MRIQLKEGIGGERRPKERVTLRITLLYENESIVQQFSTMAKDPMYTSGSNWYFERNISSQHSSMPIAYILQFARQWAQPWHFIHLQCIFRTMGEREHKVYCSLQQKKIHLCVCTVHPRCFIANCTLKHFGNFVISFNDGWLLFLANFHTVAATKIGIFFGYFLSFLLETRSNATKWNKIAKFSRKNLRKKSANNVPFLSIFLRFPNFAHVFQFLVFCLSLHYKNDKIQFLF